MTDETKNSSLSTTSDNQPSTADRLAEMVMKGVAGGGLATTIMLLTASDLPQKLMAAGIGTVGGAALTFVKPIKKRVDQELEEGGQSVVNAAKRQKDKMMPGMTGFEKKYLEALKTYCYDLTIEGFKGELPTLALDDVFVPLRLSSDAKGYVNADMVKRIWDLLPQSKQQESDRSYRRLIIVGDPGHGKTTLMKYLTLSFTTDRYKQENVKHLFPVLLLFRQLYSEIQSETSPDLPDLIVKSIKSLPRCSELQPTMLWVKEKLKKREVLVMLDGLDEVPEARRELVSRWANRQMQEYDTSFILTSRPHGYEDPDLFTGVQRVDVLDFTLEQKREFLEKWYSVVMWRQKWAQIYSESQRKPNETDRLEEETTRAQSEAEAIDAANSLMSQITGNFALNKLSANPLLVTIIAATHRAFETLPDRRAKLYQKVLNLLLEDRPNRRDTHLTLKNAADSQAILQRLALGLTLAGKTQFTKREGIAFIQERLAQKAGELNLTPEKFLREIQTIAGLLVGGESDLYQFSHKTFQEFLTAIELEQQGQGEELITRLLQQGGDALKGWEEVVSFYGAIAGADGLVSATIDNSWQDVEAHIEALKLMRRVVVVEKSSIGPALRKRLEGELVKWADFLSPISTLEGRFRQMRRIDEKTEITSEPIPEEAIEWMKKEQAEGKFQHQDSEINRSFCLWLTTLEGLRVEGKLFTYRSATAEEIRQIDLEWQDEIYVVRCEIHPRYDKLMSHLVTGAWREADGETSQLMLQVAGKEEQRYLEPDDIKTFPCEDLLTIDRLWVEASKGHFGFSVQKKIWEKCGSPMDYNDDYKKFMEAVGWRSGDDFVSYSDLNFSTSLSLAGELPMRQSSLRITGSLVVGVMAEWIAFLAQRLVNCSTTALQPENKNKL